MKKTFVYGLLPALMLAACTPKSQESSVQEAPLPKIVGEEVSYATDSTVMKGYLAYNDSIKGKRPGILVVHEWWGHNDYVRSRADQLAELGYVAIAVDMYGDGKTAAHPEDAGKFAGQVFADFDEARARFEKAMEVLKANPNTDADKIGAIGYCFGGSIVLSMANAGYELDAVAAFHAGLQLPVQPDAATLKARILVCNGADDPFVSAESVEAFKTAMDAAGANYQYMAYPGALHGFTNPDADELGKKFNLPLAYQKEADEASWSELKALFAQSF